jgi:hypothetical protein
MPLETVVINIFGDTAEQWTPCKGWQAEYAAYLEAYEKAEDKAKFNAEYFKTHKD